MPLHTSPRANPTATSNADVLKAASILTNSSDSQAHLKVSVVDGNIPIRMDFTVRYSELGMEQLYSELSKLKKDLERSRHIKRCLLDISRGDFKRSREALPSIGGNAGRKSFKLQVRISARDIGLEAIHHELLALLTSFDRQHALRRKLYEAFNPSSNPLEPMKLTSATDAAPTVDPLPIELNSDFNRHPTPLPATALDAELSEAVVPCLTDRRNAARKAAREAQVREYNQPFAQN